MKTAATTAVAIIRLFERITAHEMMQKLVVFAAKRRQKNKNASTRSVFSLAHFFLMAHTSWILESCHVYDAFLSQVTIKIRVFFRFSLGFEGRRR